MGEKEKGIIFNIQHYSLQDGPGIRTTVFLKGCPLRCRWCCNPESQNLQAERLGKELRGQKMTVQEVMDEVLKDEVFYRHEEGGMTISGGEPFMQGEFVLSLLKEAKRQYLTTAVETCGYARQEWILEASDYLDMIFFDIKSLDREKHKCWTGQDNQIILENFQALAQKRTDKPICVRTPVIPGFNDEEQDIRAICEFIQPYTNVSYELLPYHFYGKEKYRLLGRPYLMGDAVLDPERMRTLKELAQQYQRKEQEVVK